MKITLNFSCFSGPARFGSVAVMMLALAGCQSNHDSKRVLEAKFLTRLDNNRQPLEIDSPDWDEARYYAVKPTARDHYADDFNSSTYQIADGQTTILAGAFETEPYTGRVIIKHDDTTPHMLVNAHMSKGRLVRTATITHTNGHRRMAIDYDDQGKAKRIQQWDQNGTLTIPPPPKDPDLPLMYLEFGEVEIRGWLVFEKSEMDEPYQGYLVEFHDKAKLQKARSEHFVAGKPDGKAIWWYPNGKKHYEADFQNGEPEGVAYWWRSDGSIEYDANWQDTKLARATTYDPAGTENGKVRNGDGTLIFLHADGSTRLEAVYVDGVLSDEHWWDEEGKPLPKAPTLIFRVDRPFVAP